MSFRDDSNEALSGEQIRHSTSLKDQMLRPVGAAILPSSASSLFMAACTELSKFRLRS
jgi:hypothetical protein